MLDGVRLRVRAEETNREVLISDSLQGEATFTLVVNQQILDADNTDRDSDLNSGVDDADVRVVSGPDAGETEGFDLIV